MSTNETHEVVQIRSKKYSFLTIFKIVLMCMGITWLFNAFAYSTVGVNHVMAKALGLAQDAVTWGGQKAQELCDICLDAIG